MTTDKAAAPPTTRRRFLRDTASLFGVGAGVLLLNSPPATAGPAIQYTCCRDETCPNCQGLPLRYRCRPTGTCGGSVHCVCEVGKPVPCYNILCP